MCRMCVRSRSCDFYVKLKRTCRTLISLPFVCNNGTQENIGLRVDITSTNTINNSMNITRVIIGEDFIRVFATQPFWLYNLNYKFCKSNRMSCGNIHNCYNQFAKKDKNTSMVSFRRNSSVWFPSQFYIYTFVSFFWKFSLKSSLIATMVGNRQGTSRRVASTDYSLLWCILLTKKQLKIVLFIWEHLLVDNQTLTSGLIAELCF